MDNLEKSKLSCTIRVKEPIIHLCHDFLGNDTNRSQNLNDFYMQMTDQPYYIHKDNVMTYKKIFFGLSLLFLTLMVLVFYERTNIFCTLLFENCRFAHSVLCGLCFIFSLAAFGIANRMRPEQETAQHFFRKAKLRIKRIYIRKSAQLGNYWLLILLRDQHVIQAKGGYEETIDHLHDIKETTQALLTHVARSPLDVKKKESLFNQAIVELRDKLERVVRGFHL